MQITNKQVLEAWHKLTRSQRAVVKAIVKRHYAACRRNGVAIESHDRVWIEAIEMERLDRGKQQDEDESEPEKGWPFTRYWQYVTPIDRGIN